MISSIGFPETSNIGLGELFVTGFNLSPLPPAIINTTFSLFFDNFKSSIKMTSVSFPNLLIIGI